jgi:hypothetical protein
MTVIQHRRGTTAEWSASSYILEAGEIGLDTTLMKIKIGDGTTVWSGLDFIGSVDGGLLPTGGLEGQVLSKTTDTDYDAQWIDNFAPDTRILVKNDSGVSLAKGTPAMAVGATGDRISVAKAVADGSVEPRYMLGVMFETVANGSEGYLTLTGEITNLDTSAYTIGDILYIDPNTPGTFTTTEPSSPDLAMAIAIVTRVNASSGRIFVRMWDQQSGLHEQHDVLIDTPADNEVLAYDSASGVWKNQTASEANLAALTGASFTGTVNVTTANNGSSVILKNTDGTGVRVIAGESISGSLPGVIFSPYVTGVEKTSSQFYYADNGDQWVFEPTLKLGNGYLTSGSATGYIFNTIATTLNIGGAATTLNLGAATGNTTIANNLVVSGNLTVNGDQIINNTSTVEVEDSMLYIGTGNSADSMDIGIVGHRTPSGGSYQHTGFVRDATDGTWKLFGGVTSEPSGSTLDFTGATYEPIKVGAITATSGTFSDTLYATGNLGINSGKFSVDASTGNTSLTGTLTVGSGKLAAVAAANTNTTAGATWDTTGGNRVIMVASSASVVEPNARPDGTSLVAGDIWIDW